MCQRQHGYWTVFPTRVGMNRTQPSESSAHWCVPHASGDELFSGSMPSVSVASMSSRYAEDIAHTDDLCSVRQPVFDADESSSRNEIHQQLFALKALHESMRSAVDHITRHGR